MDIYFAGAESPIYLRQLINLDVTHVAISFFEWQRRHSSDDLFKHIPEDMKICITAGVARKEEIDWNSFSKDYLEFCEHNAELCLIYDMDAPNCPEKIRKSTRDMLNLFPNVVVFPLDGEDLIELASNNERIGVNARLTKSIPSNELRRISASLYGSNVMDLGTLRQGRFVATTTLTWLAGRRFGELWVFGRGKMHHYSADMLTKAVRAHRADIEAFGVDPGACAANDKTALTEVAVRSFQLMAKGLSRRPRDRVNGNIAAGPDEKVISESPQNTDELPAGLTSNSALMPLIIQEREMLPVISVSSQANGSIVSSVKESLRQCDSCYLSSTCPKYQENSSCAFSFPIEIRTREQQEAACQVIIEFQFQRIAQGHFGEQLEGGALTARLGQEMDRWFKMLESVKTLKVPDLIGGTGAISSAFGPMPQFNPTTTLEIEDDEEDDFEEGDEEDNYANDARVTSG